MPSDSSDWYAANNFMDLRICWCVCCAYGNWWVWFMPLIILCLWQMVPEYLRPRSKPKTYLPLVNIIFLISCANFLIFRRTPNLLVASLFHSLVSSHFFSLRLFGIFSFVCRLFVEALWGHVGNCCWYYSREHHYRNTCMRLRRTQIII